MNFLLSVLVPAYNEEPTIGALLQRVWEAPLPPGGKKEIIVVDDCSEDATAEAVEAFQREHPHAAVRLLRHPENRGKGAALHTAIQAARGDFLVVQDADLEYDPREYPTLLQPFLDGVADVVYGSRFMGGNPHRILFFWHSIGNKFLTFLSNAFTNLNLT
ncbi:MAG: glycosyltransferase family 2 protein, partial [Bacteroidetes bacterium]